MPNFIQYKVPAANVKKRFYKVGDRIAEADIASIHINYVGATAATYSLFLAENDSAEVALQQFVGPVTLEAGDGPDEVRELKLGDKDALYILSDSTDVVITIFLNQIDKPANEIQTQ